MVWSFMSKERKDPADIATEFMKDMEKSENSEEKEEKETEQEKKPDIKEDEKSAQLDSESSPEEEVVETLEDKEEKEEKEQIAEDKKEDKKRKPSAEQRITELISEVKALKAETQNKDKEWITRLETLEKEKEELQRKSGIAPENKMEDEVVSLEQKRISQYLEEDKRLPRENRREMSKEEFEEWLMEDVSAATDWKVDQKLRRRSERKEDLQRIRAKVEVDGILKSQSISRLRVEARHPDLALDGEKNKLLASGMSEQEVHDHLCKTNDKYRIISEIILSDKNMAEKLLLDPNGPEVLEKEMLKRLSKSKPSVETEDNETIDRLSKQIEELQEVLNVEKSRKGRIDVGITSKKGASKMEERTDKPGSEQVEATLRLLKKKGYDMTKEEYLAMEDRRKGIPGANKYGTD